jgi:hypothetical protein
MTVTSVHVEPYARALGNAMAQAICRHVPVDRAAQQAIVAGLFRTMSGGPDGCDTLFRRLGSDAVNADFLPSVCREAGHAALRQLSAISRDYRVPATVVGASAEAVFVFVERISGHARVGFATRDRTRLLRGLVAGAARHAEDLPAHVVLVALEKATRVDAVLADLECAEPYVLMAADDPLPALDVRAAVGPRVPVGEAGVSLRWARRALALVRRGVLPDVRVTYCGDHLGTLMLLTDPVLRDELVRRHLAPLAGLTPTHRARLQETLLAWLTTRRGAPEVAAQLGVHPQTVRHRLRRLVELFGERLDDPSERFVLEVALRADRLAQITAEPGGAPPG